MSVYEFELIFSLVAPFGDPDDIVNALFEAGCDDAIVGVGKRDRIALSFSRDAASAGSPPLGSLLHPVRTRTETTAVKEIARIIPKPSTIRSRSLRDGPTGPVHKAVPARSALPRRRAGLAGWSC